MPLAVHEDQWGKGVLVAGEKMRMRRRGRVQETCWSEWLWSVSCHGAPPSPSPDPPDEGDAERDEAEAHQDGPRTAPPGECRR